MVRKKTIDAETNDDHIIIKKYANRRLYNTEKSHYVTLDNLADLIRSGVNFIVLDAKTNEDITRSILTQIIAEQEAKGNYLLPISFLKDMIKIYGHDVNGLVPDYWEQSMQIFKDNREKLQKGFDEAVQRVIYPLEQFSKMADSNSQIFTHTIHKTMDMFQKFNPNKAYDTETVTLPKEEYKKLLDELKRLREA